MLKSYGIITSNWVKSCSYVTIQTANNYLEGDNGVGVESVGLTVNLN
jgi:hypothetical protein